METTEMNTSTDFIKKGDKKKITVIMPAYNAAETLKMTYDQIPHDLIDEIILVDDASHDDTYVKASELGIICLKHSHNLGYGGNQKTCYSEALRRGADVVVMVHPDGQYDPTILGDMIKPIVDGNADVVLGSRMLNRKKALEGGMPLYKWFANIFLTTCENIVLGQKLAEYHTGYRAYSRQFFDTVPVMRNSNNFVFDTEILVQASHFKMRIKETPVTTKYFTEASSVNFWNSSIYGLQTLGVLFKYILHRLRIIKCRLFLP